MIPPAAEMKERLIGQALDFVLRAAEDFEDEAYSPERQMKYATIHLYEGVELLLKARLLIEHWSLLLANVDRYDGGEFEKGDFVSASFSVITGSSK